MFILFSFLLLILIFFLSFLFIFLGSKNYFEFSCSTIYECGFMSYFFSRYSFSSHYFLISLIFLFLDLELCLIMPAMLEFFCFELGKYLISIFIFVLLVGLLFEWLEGKLDWMY